MIRQFTPPGLHLPGPRPPNGHVLALIMLNFVNTVIKKPKKVKKSVKMSSEHIKQ